MATLQVPRPPSRASHASRASVASRGLSLYSVGSVHSVRSTVARSHAGFSQPADEWRPPVLAGALGTSIPRASHVTAAYAILQALFTIITSMFDVYVLAEAEPGKNHYGYYIISFEFVYVGNAHVRRCLIVLALVSAVSGIVLLVFSAILLRALKQEDERRIRPWLLVMIFHTIWRTFAFVFSSIVNDMYFSYHGVMCFLWAAMVLLNVYGWLVVWSFFNELAEVSKLEDIAHLKMGTMTSLNATPYGWHRPSIGYSSHRPSIGYSTHRPSIGHSTHRPSISYSLHRPSISADMQHRPSVDHGMQHGLLSADHDTQRRPSVSVSIQPCSRPDTPDSYIGEPV